MRLLFDENLSESIRGLIEDIFPNSEHVRLSNLMSASDSNIWQYASSNRLAIVSKDSDFVERAVIGENGTKVVWLRLGNCSTANVHLLLRNKKIEIEQFLASEDVILELP